MQNVKTVAEAARYALLVAARIADFSADCEAANYTDTGDAWALLDEAQAALRAVAEAAGD
jgi:hypothetical protein